MATEERASPPEQQPVVSTLAKELGIRISAPHGYYPEDVDPILEKYSSQLDELQKENAHLKKDLADAEEKKKRAVDELAALKMQVTLMDVPDLSTEEEFAMLGQMDSITGNYNSESVQELKDDTNIEQPKNTTKKLKIHIN